MSVGSVLILIFGNACAGYIFVRGNVTDARRREARNRIRSQWQLARVRVRNSIYDEALSTALQRAGLHMSAAMYQYIRYVLTGITLLFAALGVLVYHDLFVILLPVLVWVLFAYQSPWPASYLLDTLHKWNQAELNKELYLLTGLIKQHLDVYRNQRRSIYDILLATTPYVPKLKYAINHCLTLWPRDPDTALDTFAADLGTKEAYELAQILRHINESNIEVAFDRIQSRKHSFQDTRMKAYKQRGFVQNTIVYGICMGTIVLVLVNIIMLYATYQSSIIGKFL